MANLGRPKGSKDKHPRARGPRVLSDPLSDEIRACIVTKFACFQSGKEIVQAIKEKFDIDVPLRVLNRYDPERRSGKRLSQKWTALHSRTRETFLRHMEQVPLAQKSVRVQKLAKAAEAFEAMRNYIAMADMLERIAKEMGNVHTNRHEFTGKDGGAIQYQDVSSMSTEEIQRELSELFGHIERSEPAMSKH